MRATETLGAVMHDKNGMMPTQVQLFPFIELRQKISAAIFFL